MPGVTTAYQTGVHGSRPAASAGCILYACSTHSLIYRSDGTTWTTWMTIGSTTTTVASDAIWDAAGDLAVGSGADTAVRLAKGNAGAHLAVINGVLTWDSGTSFPGSAVAGDRYWRTDITGSPIEFFYDGTRWRSVQIFDHEWWLAAAATADVGHWSPQIAGATDIWVVDYRWIYNVPGNHSGTKYWTAALNKFDGATVVTLATLTTDQSTTTWNAPAATAIGALVGLTNEMLWFALVKVSTPDASTFGMSFRYQLVAT